MRRRCASRTDAAAICPFCYIGYKKFDKARELFAAEGGKLDFSLHFEPFQLDPTLPLDSPVVKRERYAAKFGGAARVAAMEVQMKERAKEVGIDLSCASSARTGADLLDGGNLRATRDSHRLLAKAHEVGGEAKQRALAEHLFADYFEKECVTPLPCSLTPTGRTLATSTCWSRRRSRATSLTPTRLGRSSSRTRASPITSRASSTRDGRASPASRSSSSPVRAARSWRSPARRILRPSSRCVHDALALADAAGLPQACAE